MLMNILLKSVRVFSYSSSCLYVFFSVYHFYFILLFQEFVIHHIFTIISSSIFFSKICIFFVYIYLYLFLPICFGKNPDTFKSKSWQKLLRKSICQSFYTRKNEMKNSLGGVRDNTTFVQHLSATRVTSRILYMFWWCLCEL